MFDTQFLFVASFKAAILLMIACGVCFAIRRHSAALRHRVWVFAACASLLVPIAMLFLPSTRLAVLPADMSASAPNAPASVTANPIAPVKVDVQSEIVSVEKLDEASEANSNLAAVPMSLGLPKVEAPSKQAPVVASTFTFNPTLVLWLLGVFVTGFPYAFSLGRQWLRKRRLPEITNTDWCNTISQLSNELDLQRRVRCYESGDHTVPAVFGILQSYLIVPSDWQQWSDSQRRCILLHELAHVKRADVATQLIGRVMVAAYWFNPLAWYAKRQLRVERELACDDCVLLTGQKASVYAQQLLNTLRTYRTQRMTAGVAMAHSARLDQRVLAILENRSSRFPVSPTVSTFSLLGTLVLVASLATVSFAAKPAEIVATDTAATETKAENEDAPKKLIAVKDKTHTQAFKGQVLHGDNPIAGATIALWQRYPHEGFYERWHPREELDPSALIVGKSDSQGSFEFTFSKDSMSDTPWSIWAWPMNQVQVVVSKEGMGIGWCTLGQLKERGKIWIRSTHELRGRVTDLEGQPVAGCNIGVHVVALGKRAYDNLNMPEWTGLSKNVITNSEGLFAIKGLPASREVHLLASGPKIATKTFRVNMGAESTSPVDVLVEETKPIFGTVRDIDTGKPVAGLIVYGDEKKYHRTIRAVTNEQGEYRLDGMPKSNVYPLTLYSPFSVGYLVRYTKVADSPGLKPVRHDIQVRRGVPVELTVIDKETRKRLQPEIHYAPTDNNPLHHEDSSWDYKPGDGYWRFYSPDENGVVRFLAYPGPGAIHTMLQGSGEYISVGETAEIKKLMKIDMNFGFAALSKSYAVIDPKPEEKLTLTLEADKGIAAKGNLLDETGQRVKGVDAYNLFFNAYENQSNVVKIVWRTKVNGDSFFVRKVLAGKPRFLAFVHPDRKLIGMTTVTAENLPPEDVVLQKWGVVFGKLVDAGGKPIANAKVQLGYPDDIPNRGDGPWPPPPTVTSDSDGKFRVERLFPNLQHKLTFTPSSESKDSSIEKTGIQPKVGEEINLGEIEFADPLQ